MVNGNLPTLISAVPWLVALIGLAVPLVGGGGAGWIYVMGWLVVLVGIAVLKPMRLANRRDRISSAAITACVLVLPGLIVGGLYLVPAALAWLVIEIKVPLRGGEPGPVDRAAGRARPASFDRLVPVQPAASAGRDPPAMCLEASRRNVDHAGTQERDHVVGGDRPAEEETLGVRAAEPTERLGLRLRLDAFGDRPDAELARQSDH